MPGQGEPWLELERGGRGLDGMAVQGCLLKPFGVAEWVDAIERARP